MNIPVRTRFFLTGAGVEATGIVDFEDDLRESLWGFSFFSREEGLVGGWLIVETVEKEKWVC